MRFFVFPLKVPGFPKGFPMGVGIPSLPLVFCAEDYERRRFLALLLGHAEGWNCDSEVFPREFDVA